MFVPAPNGTNLSATIYVCRPVVAPAWIGTANYPGNSLTAFNGAPEQYASGNGSALGPVPSISSQTCSFNTTGGTGGTPQLTPGTKVGVFRNNTSFLEDSNGNEQVDPSPTDAFITTFNPSLPGGPKPGDLAVTGDWNGNGKWGVGIYRSGVWYIDTNKDGIWDAGDLGFPSGVGYGGIAGDVPVTGDWTGLGKSCIGVFRQGFLWLLDLNCNGVLDATPTDAAFGFGGIQGDMPVTGNWVGGAGSVTRVGIVRDYVVPGQSTPAPGSVPFLWIFDSANPNAGNAASAHPPAIGAFPFGGIAGDVYVTGDWLNTGAYRAGIYRGGAWILDTGVNGATVHTADTFFGFGGLSGDQAITGKW